MAIAAAPRDLVVRRDTGIASEAALRPAIRVEAMTGTGTLAAIEAAWDDLASNAAEPNPFFERFMLRPALRHLAGARNVEVLAVFDGTLMTGLLPIRVHATYRGLPLRTAQAWVHLHCFLATPLLRAGHERAAIRAVADHLRLRGIKVLRLRHMAADGPVAAAIDAVAADEGLGAIETRRFERAVLRSDLDGEAYLAASINKKRRKEYARLERRLGDLGPVRFETADQADAAAVEGSALIFLALEASGWKGRTGTALACRRAEQQFFLDACHAAAEQERFHPLTLVAGDTAVASIINFDGVSARGASRSRSRSTKHRPGSPPGCCWNSISRAASAGRAVCLLRTVAPTRITR